MMHVIKHLIKYGYLRAEDPTDDSLPLDSTLIQNAVLLYQTFFQEQLNEICLDMYGRQLVIDGEVGPATKHHMTRPRCGFPDILSGGDSLVEVLGGKGSWPEGCHGSAPFHQVNIKINRNRMPSFLEPVFEKVLLNVEALYANIGMRLNFFADNNSVNIDFSFENLAGSTIGLAIVPRGPQCGSRIWCKYDPSYNPSETEDQWSWLIAHELGHNMGLGHTNGGIMNPSIIRGKFSRTAWKGDPSERTLTTWFGGKSTDPLPPPIDPPPPPPPEKGLLNYGVVNVDKGTYYLNSAKEDESNGLLTIEGTQHLLKATKLW